MLRETSSPKARVKQDPALERLSAAVCKTTEVPEVSCISRWPGALTTRAQTKARMLVSRGAART